jgi:hypothetical protein
MAEPMPEPLRDGPLPDHLPEDAEPDRRGWSFTAVGLNGRTRTVRVDRLRGAVRLLTPGDRVPAAGIDRPNLPPLPHAFIWNADTRTFEPIEPDTPDSAT